MALTYLQLVNRVLKRIENTEISEVTTATGNALIISEMINEAQTVISNEANWQSLYTTRTFATVASTAFYDLATDFGKGIDLINTTSNLILNECNIQDIDAFDSDASDTGTPTYYAIAGNQYRLYPTPSAVETIRDRYYKVPTTLSANTGTSTLPLECEPCIIYYTLARMHETMKENDEGDRCQVQYQKFLEAAKKTNAVKINQMHVFRAYGASRGTSMAVFPAEYGRGR